ncbi:glycoside hydrolase family 36 protein [uncultured Massilia sp.]|uniref:glycoside hydrolase family 36 protein n=1 Tax=uncultured Massilia sp. TaxID=169973 RepID=UPI0025D92D08|nr:glycoside hydrolase family 36 protein [uncultured Massilia sp.]
MNQAHDERRRSLLQWLAGTAVASTVGPAGAAAVQEGKGRNVARVGDAAMALEFDAGLQCRVVSRRGPRPGAVTAFAPSERLRLADGRWVGHFALAAQAADRVAGPHGPGVRHRFTGMAPERIEKTVSVTFYERHPGFAVIRTSYRNAGDKPLPVAAWANSAHTLRAAAGRKPAFWTYSGATHPDRRDWVQPVRRGFEQRNFMGMNGSDYGGGTPAVDVWQRDCGLAVGHLDTVPRLVALPVRQVEGGASLAVEFEREATLQPGETLDTLETFLALHTGDYFAALDGYRKVMAERGLAAPDCPEDCYQPIWCAWGYERDFTVPLMVGTLQKARELGLEWAVLDDGWQNNEGDWKLDRKKFPNGDADMRGLVGAIQDAGMKARLWITPLAVDPGSDLLHDHVDMLLLDKDGAPQLISWWNSLYLCPAYAPTIEMTRAWIRKIFGEWGYQGIKIDGQHLNGVAPCHNPAHKHARPEESFEKLQDFWKMVYDTAREVNPNAVVELCPCGTSYAFHNFPYMNQAPASDPLSSWQVRHKGKTIKALMGPSAPYAGDHVELSDGGQDFASTVGIGAVLSTKFTWPVDPKPKDSFLLTPEREVVWRKWIGIYREKMLPRGVYRGELYDIGFDRPEGHAVEKDGRMYFAFFAPEWDGPVEIRGLGAGRWKLRDYVDGRELGEVTGAGARVTVRFAHALLLEAVPA